MKKSDSKVSSDSSSQENSTYFVYILRTSSNTLYIGQTNNLEKRLKQHSSHSSISAKYLRMFTSFELVYTETLQTRSAAMKREAELKKWSRAKKETLINRKKYLSNTSKSQ